MRPRDLALRAAFVVTLAGGCADTTNEGGEQTAGAECPEGATTPECCEAEHGGTWDDEAGTCAVVVPGPFVPPAMA